MEKKFMKSDDDDMSWRLDRRVPLALVFAVILQTGLTLVWAGSAAERLDTLEGNAIERSELLERTTRLEERTRNIEAMVTRIEARLNGR